MAIHIGLSSHHGSHCLETKNPNPDPYIFKIIAVEQIGNFIIIKVNYPSCTNYEGNKILVYKDVPLVDIMNSKPIDPHFLDNEHHISPVARFKPDEEGWDMACNFCKRENYFR